MACNCGGKTQIVYVVTGEETEYPTFAEAQKVAKHTGGMITAKRA